MAAETEADRFPQLWKMEEAFQLDYFIPEDCQYVQNSKMETKMPCYPKRQTQLERYHQ
jgi:hypothetical protein